MDSVGVKFIVDFTSLHLSSSHLQTGNFKVDSKGQQLGVKEKRFAGSEAHLIEVLENICDLMQNYGETTDPKTGKKGYMRINSRDGETITISNVNFSAGGSQDLSNAVSRVKG